MDPARPADPTAHMSWLPYVSYITRELRAELCLCWLEASWCSVQICLSLANESGVRFVRIEGPVVK